MSNNTNSLFWIITGAVIVLAAFLVISSTNNNTISKIFDDFSNHFFDKLSDSENEDPEEEIPEVDLNQYIPSGWNLMGIVMTNGVVYVTGNVNNFYGGGCQFDARIINTNPYEVHIKNAKITFINSETHEIILLVNSQIDRILAPGDVIITGISTGKDVGKTNHYMEFIPWS